MNNVLDLLKQSGIVPKLASSSKGGEHHSPCPECGGNDRFHVWPDQNGGDGSYWCRGCAKSGDNIQFLIDFQGMTFPEACEQLGIELDSKPKTPSVPSPAQRQVVKTTWQPEVKGFPPDVVNPALWQEKAGNFMEKCHELLLENDKSMAWLAARGVNRQSVVNHRLGLNPGRNGGPEYRPWKSWGLVDKENSKTSKPQTFILPAGIVIPCIVEGKVRRLRIRLAQVDQKFPKKKYHVVRGSAADTMVINPKAKAFVIEETELDAIMIVQEAGDLVGVISLGTASAKPDQRAAEILRRALKVLDANDYDQAGAAARHWWRDNYQNSIRWPVPDGGDPGEAYQKGVDIRAWILAGLPPVFHVGDRQGAILSGLCCEEKRDFKKREAEVIPVVQSAVPSEKLAGFTQYPATVLELKDLLGKYPVKIDNSPEQVFLLYQKSPDQNFQKAVKRISELVFMDVDAAAYVGSHPQKIITAGNLLVG